MQQDVGEKDFDEFIKFNYLNDRLDVFLGKYFLERKICGVCVVNFHSFPWSEFH